MAIAVLYIGFGWVSGVDHIDVRIKSRLFMGFFYILLYLERRSLRVVIVFVGLGSSADGLTGDISRQLLDGDRFSRVQ
jgi:hypothetical protein